MKGALVDELIKSNVATDGTKLCAVDSFLHSALFNLQYDTLKLAEKINLSQEEILSALAAIRRQWGTGYPGVPQFVVFDTIDNNPVADSRKYFAAGVFYFIEHALEFERANNHGESGRFFHEAEEMYAFLRVDTGELFEQFKEIQARNAAEKRHTAPGGARSKALLIREKWASGKYSSRDICAEQESAALGMSFSTARKALRGTPVPLNTADRRAAKNE